MLSGAAALSGTMIRELFTSPDRRARARRKIGNFVRANAYGFDLRYENFQRKLRGRGTDPAESANRLAKRAPWASKPEYFDGRLSHEEREALIREAESRLNGVVDLLGSGPVDIGAEPDWHRDFIGGYRWESHVHFSSFDWSKLPDKVDIKVPWELSRCMHFGTWGVAFLLTRDVKFYEGFKSQVIHWLDNNPFEKGVNWACPMDVGLRAANWINALCLFQEEVRKEQESFFLERILKSLWFHGRHLARNLEWNGPVGRTGGNHLLANLVGMLAIGQLFPNEPWHDFARKELENQVQRQTLQDGCNFELATSYHRLVLEMFIWAGQIETGFSSEYDETVGRMRKFVAAYSEGSGLSPQFGDNDSGRLFCTGIDDERNHGYLIGQDAGMGSRVHQSLLWMDHLERVTATKDEFPDGGFWFFRNGEGVLGFRAGALSATGGHAHCDQLSFVLTVFGERIFVDRGVYCYTSDTGIRNRFRSTAAHNTVMIGGREQNYFGRKKRELFGIRDDTKTKVISASKRGIKAEHFGFEGVKFGRRLELREGGLEISDTFEGDGLVKVEWYFHFSPECEPKLEGQRVYVKVVGGEVRLRVPEGLEATLVESEHSDSYGSKQPAKSLVIKGAKVTGAVSMDISWKQ